MAYILGKVVEELEEFCFQYEDGADSRIFFISSDFMTSKVLFSTMIDCIILCVFCFLPCINFKPFDITCFAFSYKFCFCRSIYRNENYLNYLICFSTSLEKYNFLHI